MWVPEDKVKDINDKKVFKTKAQDGGNSEAAIHHDIDACIKKLQTGMSGQKVNFSNKQMKRVFIKLSKDGKTLLYQKLQSDQSCLDKIKG